MDDSKLKAKLASFINKINEERFDTTTITDFYSSIRWSDIEKLFPITYEISNFVAHQSKDRGVIVDRLNCWTVISDFIEQEKITNLKPFDARQFPKMVIEAIFELYGDDIKRFYDLEVKTKIYKRNKRPDPQLKINKYINKVFFTLDFLMPLVEVEQIYTDFFGSLNYFAGKFGLTRLKALSKSQKRDLLICILSVLASAQIKFKNETLVYLTFKETGDSNVDMRFNNPTKHQAVGITFKGASSQMLFTNFSFDGQQYGFYKSATVLERDENLDLKFVKVE